MHSTTSNAEVNLFTMAPSRKSKPAASPPPSRTLVLDNGANTIKAGFVTADAIDEPRVIPNCLARDRDRKTYIASDLAKCKDFGEIAFRRPVEKGYIVNWEAQKEIWDHEFCDNKAPQKCDPSETRLVLAEQPNSLPVLQSNCDQMVFEEFGFASYYRGVGTAPLLYSSCPSNPANFSVDRSILQRLPRHSDRLPYPWPRTQYDRPTPSRDHSSH